jgi:hypothetical protein
VGDPKVRASRRGIIRWASHFRSAVPQQRSCHGTGTDPPCPCTSIRIFGRIVLSLTRPPNTAGAEIQWNLPLHTTFVSGAERLSDGRSELVLFWRCGFGILVRCRRCD